MNSGNPDTLDELLEMVKEHKVNSGDLPPQTKIPNMFMLSEAMYHRPETGPITSLKHVSDIELQTDEEVYRVINRTIGEDWEPVDCGWLKKVSTLYVLNHKTQRPTYPSQEEIQADEDAVIELAYRSNKDDCVWEIPKDTTFRGRPKDPTNLHMRCRKGTTTFSLTAIPS